MRLARPLAALCLVATAVGLVPARPAAAWSDGACGPAHPDGVTVIVDFQELGGGVNVRCTETAPSDGADALDRAGIAWQGVVRWGRSFVCKIAGKPADDPCIDTPPASAYWSYWVAPRGGTWCYSNLGVLARTPPPGSVEGWSFSLHRDGSTSPAPGMAPPAPLPGVPARSLPAGHCDPSGPAVPTTAPPTTRPPATTTPSVPRPPVTTPAIPGGTAPGGAAPAGPVPSSTPNSTTSTSTTVATSSTTSMGPSTTSAESPVSTTAAGGSADGEETAAGPRGGNQVNLSSDGSEQDGLPVSMLLGIGAIAAIGGASWWRARQRAAAAAAAATSLPFTTPTPESPDSGA